MRAILNAERSSKLYVDPTNLYNRLDFSKVEKTWYTAFFQLLTQDCRVEQLPDRLRSVTFIIFNYDRCVEHFLWSAIRNYYDISDEQTTSLMSDLTLLHPYGTVGALPWQRADQAVPYGVTPTAHQLLSASGLLRTFTEGTDPRSSDIGRIHERLAEASTVLFLGFAFHPINLRLLTSERKHSDQWVRYFGTAKGVSRSDVRTIVEDLSKLAGANHDWISLLPDTTCVELFNEYWRTLQMG